MNNFLSIRNVPPNDGETIQTGTSPGWLKGNVFSEMYPHMSESDVEAEDDFLKTSLGDPSFFIDEYSQNTFDDVDEGLLPLSLIQDLHSPFPATRKASIDCIIKTLKKEQNENPMNFKLQMKRIGEFVNNCSYLDIQNDFFNFANYNTNNQNSPDTASSNDTTSYSTREDFLDRILEWHPSYFEKYLKSHNYIMSSDGPLPYYVRNYIAIIAVARFKCRILIRHQEEQFLMNGGDPSWLEDIKNTPPKMKAIFELNEVLAHQPWRITLTHIENVIKGTHQWSLSELAHAAVIMATFRTVASLILGMSIVPDFPCFYSDKGEEETIEKICTNHTVEECKNPNSDENKKIKAEKFEEAGKEAPTVIADEDIGDDDLLKYIGEYKMIHQNFDVRSKEYDIYRFNEFTWGEYGFDTLQRFYNVASLLDDKFTVISELTYNRVKDSLGIDTAHFRRAIWNYAHRLQGIEHDDYSYELVNRMIKIPMKSFVKKIVCKPYQIQPDDIKSASFDLNPEEICHIILLAAEARLQGELVYVLRAIHRYLSTS